MRHKPILAAALIFAATPAAAELTAQDFDYDVGGVTMQGYIATNTAIEPRGTVLIVHDWDGLTDYEKRRAEMLATMGYTAVAIDVYGKDRRPTSMQENQARTGELYGNRELFRERLMGSLEAAKQQDGVGENIALMGYCFGGAAVLEAARAGMDVDAFVSFHGGLGTPEGQTYDNVTAPVLLLHGSADPVSGMADLASLLDQLQAAGIEHDARIFGGARHTFTVWGTGDYDLDADRGSWSTFQDFLAENL